MYGLIQIHHHCRKTQSRWSCHARSIELVCIWRTSRYYSFNVKLQISAQVDMPWMYAESVRKSIKRIALCYRGLDNVKGSSAYRSHELAKGCTHCARRGLSSLPPCLLCHGEQNTSRRADTPSTRVPWENGSEFFKPPTIEKWSQWLQMDNQMANPILCLFQLLNIRNILISKVRRQHTQSEDQKGGEKTPPENPADQESQRRTFHWLLVN